MSGKNVMEHQISLSKVVEAYPDVTMMGYATMKVRMKNGRETKVMFMVKGPKQLLGGGYMREKETAATIRWSDAINRAVAQKQG